MPLRGILKFGYAKLSTMIENEGTNCSAEQFVKGFCLGQKPTKPSWINFNPFVNAFCLRDSVFDEALGHFRRIIHILICLIPP